MKRLLNRFLPNSCVMLVLLGGLIAEMPRSVAHADTPRYLPFQGFLTDASGTPIDGARNITFEIYDALTAGNLIYSEIQQAKLSDGFFNVYIGAAPMPNKPLPVSLFNGKTEYYLSITIGGDTAPLSPRTLLAYVPYAFFANSCADAATVGGQASSAFAPVSHTTPWSTITGVPGDLADGDADTKYSAAGSSGLDLSGTAFSIDYNIAQRRVTGSCAAGTFVRAVAADGSVTCSADADTNTTYTAAANSGINLNGTAFGLANNVAGAGLALSNGTINLAPDNGTCAAGQVLKTNGNGAWSCFNDIDTNTTYSAANGGGLAVAGNAFSIAGAGVTGAMIASATITGANVAAATLTGGATGNIAANTITAANLAPGSVGASEIGSGVVGLDELDDLPAGSDDVQAVLGATTNLLIAANAAVPLTTIATCMVTASFVAAGTGAETSAPTMVAMAVSTASGGAGVTTSLSKFPAAAVPITSTLLPAAMQPTTSTATTSFTVKLAANTSTRFGCQVTAGAEWSGMNGDCQVSWMCF